MRVTPSEIEMNPAMHAAGMGDAPTVPAARWMAE